MQKLLILLSVTISPMVLKSQNFQLHYDMGKDRKYLTSTVEMYKPDKWGSTFFFIDMDYGAGDVKGVSLGYFEFSRGLKFWKSPFEVHIEYNGGFLQSKSPADGLYHAYQINDAWLFGGNYTWNTKDFSKVFTLEAMYKNIRGKTDMSFQITGVWTIQLLKNKFTLCGFADFWKEDNLAFNGIKTYYVFLAEPQFWYNFTDHFSIGSEVEVSSNFGGHDGLMVNPTIAGKWKF